MDFTGKYDKIVKPGSQVDIIDIIEQSGTVTIDPNIWTKDAPEDMSPVSSPFTTPSGCSHHSTQIYAVIH